MSATDTTDTAPPSVAAAPPPSAAPRRVMFVHAHPDDEVIGTGVTLARYAADPSTHVTLVTCTLGEMGEVLVPELINLRSDKDDQLGGYRIGELAAACRVLGVTDQRFLGGPGRWRDSGMMGTPANDDPRCLWRADLDEAGAALVAIVRDVRPQVIVTYDEHGGYGHPDHIRANNLATRAFDAAADPAVAPGTGEPWRPSKLYHTATPRSALQRGIDLMREKGAELFEGVTSAADIPFAVEDSVITARIDGEDLVGRKMDAMRAHATQMTVDGFFFALADGLGQQVWAREHFTLARGEAGPRQADTGWESDLFAGLPIGSGRSA
jgi:N-acetyl-1-D-myo-inositol-2-amino-2-deoxy-alpha-D-glucopyranoside deacetylase